MINIGTLKDANQIQRSPFLQPESVRFSDKAPSIFDSYSAWRLCKQRATHANIATFHDVKPESCAATFVMYLRAAVFGEKECMTRILSERRAIYDPTVLPWKPRRRYMEQLAFEQRLPAEVEDELVAEIQKEQQQQAKLLEHQNGKKK